MFGGNTSSSFGSGGGGTCPTRQNIVTCGVSGVSGAFYSACSPITFDHVAFTWKSSDWKINFRLFSFVWLGQQRALAWIGNPDNIRGV